jgi:molybdopterin molybdotransferase
MLTVEKARNIITENLKLLDIQQVKLQETSGRVLAEDITALFPMPRFDNSAMDGFAVRAADIAGAGKDNPVSLKMVGGVSAGDPGDLVLKPGECVQCMTGAPIPEGADAVVMVEDTSGYDSSGTVKIYLEAYPGKHIRRKGEEISEGDVLIQKKTKITPAEMGTLATFGYKQVQVYRSPRVALIGTGDELVKPGRPLKPGQIYNSNLFVFSDLAKRLGAKVIIDDIVADDPKALHTCLSQALMECDVVISSGGVSMGRHDYVRKIFMELGVSEHFWRVAQKPGKPLFFGTTADTLIFGLPGNPVSSFIGFMEWVWPAIEKMMGITASRTIPAILADQFPRERVKTRFLFGRAWWDEGHLVCASSLKVGSHMLSSSLDANCIISSEPGDKPLQPGEMVQIRILPWKSIP